MRTKIEYTCQITGRRIRDFAECPILYVKQALRYESAPFARLIAEDRYKKAIRLRKQRKNKWDREHELDRLYADID